MEKRQVLKRRRKNGKVNDWQGKKKGIFNMPTYLANLGIEKQTGR